MILSSMCKVTSHLTPTPFSINKKSYPITLHTIPILHSKKYEGKTINLWHRLWWFWAKCCPFFHLFQIFWKHLVPFTDKSKISNAKKNFWLTHSSPRPLGEVSEYEGLHRLRLCNRPSYPLVGWSVKQWPQFCSSSHKFFVCGYLCHQPLSIHFCSIWVLWVLFRCNYLYYYFVGLVPVHKKLPSMELGRRLSSDSACRFCKCTFIVSSFWRSVPK